MSNGLADASFFPTAKELSTGLRWVKDHPVLAAAAATAVSVITFLNAAETLAHSRSSTTLFDDSHDDDSHDRSSASLDGSAAVFQKHDVVARRRKVESESHARASAAAKLAAATLPSNSNSSSGRTSPPSDAKLTAAVSWCDEHGGSLTQVFEDMHVTDDAVDSDSKCIGSSVTSTEASAGAETDDLVSAMLPVTIASRRPPTGASVIKKSSTQQSILSALDQDLGGDDQCDDDGGGDDQCDDDGGDDDPRDVASPNTTELLERQTESPQWGWYVAITPPQDHLHGAMPRAVLPPPHRSNSSSCAPPHTAIATGASLRRSTSGRISS